MNKIGAVTELRAFLRMHGNKLDGLRRDSSGKIDVTEIRKLLAVDAEMAIALATLISIIYISLEHEARAEINATYRGI